MNCPNCSSALKGDEKFCANCGAKIPAPGTCPRCGTENAAQNRFCSNCGFSFEDVSKNAEAPVTSPSDTLPTGSAPSQTQPDIHVVSKKGFTLPVAAKYLGIAIIVIIVVYLARDILSMPVSDMFNGWFGSTKVVPHKADSTISIVRDGYIADQTDVTLGTVLESERPEGTWSAFEENGSQGVLFDCKSEVEEIGLTSQETIRFVLLDKERFKVESITIQLSSDDGDENVTLTGDDELFLRMSGYYANYYGAKHPQEAGIDYLSDTDPVNFIYGASSSYTGSRNFVETLSKETQSAVPPDMPAEQSLSSNAQSTDVETFKLDTTVPHFYIQSSDSGYAYNPGLETSMALYPDGTFQYNHTFPESIANAWGSYTRQGDNLYFVFDGPSNIDFAKKGAMLIRMQGNSDWPSLEFSEFDPPLDYDPIAKGTVFNEVAELFYQKHKTNKEYTSGWIDKTDYKIVDSEQAMIIIQAFLKERFGDPDVSFMLSEEDDVGCTFEVHYADSMGAASSLLGHFYVDKLTGTLFDYVLGDRIYESNLISEDELELEYIKMVVDQCGLLACETYVTEISQPDADTRAFEVYPVELSGKIGSEPDFLVTHDLSAESVIATALPSGDMIALRGPPIDGIPYISTD